MRFTYKMRHVQARLVIPSGEELMEFIDTHTHMDDDAFAGDLDDVIDTSRAKGVTRWINVGYNEARWQSTHELAKHISGMSLMLGLHPGNADDWNHRVHTALVDAVRTIHPVAIGEIGLDLYWRQDNLALQEQVFRTQLEIAVEHGLPTVIHMRAADAELIEVLDSVRPLPHIHFHSFDGGDDLRAWVLRNNATVGVGGLVTRKGSESLRGWISGVPRHIVVLESDSPYLKPRGIRGKRNEPAYLPKTADLLGELWGLDVERVSEITSRNAERIFGLKEVKARWPSS